MSSVRASVAREAAGSVFAGRYRIDRLLGAGGMGEVHLVVDQVTHRRMALKRLRRQASDNQRRLFENEFHTLASLKHANIVEAYDYGIADGAPYYTMELLEGCDLRTLAPMPWVDACRCLREVASTLGILHARRLLHRDLSPRNVWRNLDGSIKLLDFGALASFGVPRDISGTPAFIPPEALNTQPLDQRSDLYMLGALGYWLLSGSLPYGARQLGDLFEAWKQTPPPPSQRVRALAREDLPPPPAELDALIESLLSQAPNGRPNSTAEIVDALSELARLPPINTHSAAQGYIHSKAFAGRVREHEQLQTRLNTAASGVGGSVVYEGAPGVGRSRLLTELCLRARLAGACVLSLSAEHFQGPYGLARGLALSLLDVAPEAARAGKSLAPVLGHLDQTLGARLGGPGLKLAALSDATGERRVRLQAALRDLFLRVASTRLLVIAIDDLQWVDDSSAALLVALAEAAERHKLLLLTTLPADEKELCAPTQALRSQATRMSLPALSAAETTELLRSVFDEVPNLARFAERLQRVAQGNPAHCMELAEHLVRTGRVRYVDGSWVLPPELDDHDLPNSRDAALLERLKLLSSDARALAGVLTVASGSVGRATGKALSPLSAEATESALTALESAGILSAHEDTYRFTHALLRDTLAAELDPQAERRAHATLGQLLLQQGDLDLVERVRVGVHLLRGGDEPTGAALVVAAALKLTGADALIAATPLLQQALALFRAGGRNQHEQLVIVARLATAAYYVDRRLAPYGHDAMRLVEDVFRLRSARALRPLLGAKLSVVLVLLWAALGFAVRRNNPRVPPFREALSLAFQAVSAMTGVATVCIDPDRASRYASLLEPLSALGPNHVASLVCDFNQGLAATVRDRPSDSLKRWHKLLTRLKSPEPIVGMPEDVRKLYLGGALYACGVLECWRDSSKALEYADELCTLDMTMYEMSADQLRTLYYANQGNLELLERYRQRVEMHAIQRGSAWQVELWSPGAFIGLHLRTHDALGMKRVHEELKRLREELPSFATYTQRAAGSYLMLRGKYAEALPALTACSHEEPLAIVGWARSHGSLARAYNGLGEHEKAREVCEHALSRLSPDDLDFPALNLNLQIEHALALLGLGEAERAARDVDALLARHNENEGPLTLGALSEARARIALAMGDATRATNHFLIMESWYRSTKIPSLIQRCARLAKELSAASGTLFTATGYDDAQVSASLERMFTDVTTVTQCAERVLGLMAKGASEAYLFVPDTDGVKQAAQLGGDAPPPEITSWVAERVKAASEDDNTVLLEDAIDAALNHRGLGDRDFHLNILYAAEAYRDVVVGALVMVRPDPTTPLKPELVAALCSYLHKALLSG